ncbi:hypothetical protein [Bradyrhizobium sp. SSUT77]|uniref:hypothetical protein n=1 Tax=Bradyrhizobium sp. SSUT77 TaxID=3040603 RepID=UPI00244ADDBC|nr:hypothetical protein [Bradyrhizobium sp. SSUT77]MDH2343238.1 hypothetical protein [Bradyrhizobium sp. SSUT77]
MIAIGISAASLVYSKRSYDLSAARDERELADKLPAIDVQVRPDGATSAMLTISIANRGEVNLAPLDITAEHSFEAGELYLSSAQQSADSLKTSLSLASMGTVAPKGVGSLKARLFGATDGKDDRFVPGLELRFDVRVRVAEQQDNIKTFVIARRILPPLAAEPCPPSWTLVAQPPGCK